MEKFKGVKVVTVFNFVTGARESMEVISCNKCSIKLEYMGNEILFNLSRANKLFTSNNFRYCGVYDIVPPGAKDFFKAKRIYDKKYAQFNLEKLEVIIPARMESIEHLKKDLENAQELLEGYIKEEKQYRDFLSQEEEGL